MAGPFSITDLRRVASEREVVRYSGLRGSSPAFAVATAVPDLECPVLWVTPDAESADQVLSELRFFGVDSALLLPEWDVEPYAGYSPGGAVVRRRLHALCALLESDKAVVVAPARALLKRCLPPSELLDLCDELEVGQEIDRDGLVRALVERGYLSTDLCTEPGSFAVRGGILDIYGPGRELPLRVEFWGDEVESMRSYDPITQRSVEEHQRCAVLPVRDVVLDSAVLEALPGRLKEIADERGLAPSVRRRVQQELEESRVLQELELFLPVVQPNLSTVFDYLGDGGLVLLQEPQAIDALLADEHERMEGRWLREKGRQRLLPEPDRLFLTTEQLEDGLAARGRVVLGELFDEDDTSTDGRQAGVVRWNVTDHGDLRGHLLAARDRQEGMLSPLLQRLETWRKSGFTVRIVTPSKLQAEQIEGLLEAHSIGLGLVETPNPWVSVATTEPALARLQGELRRGFCWPEQKLVLVSGDEIVGVRRRRTQVRSLKGHEPIGSLRQMQQGALVVHSIHGIGRFLGLSKLRLGATAAEVRAEQRARAQDPSYIPGSQAAPRVGGRSEADGAGSAVTGNDFLLLEYRGGDRLYLPVHKLDLMARYVSPGGPEPRLDKLGGQTWQKRRKKVAEEVQKVARELLELYARRQVATGRPCPPPDAYYREFCAGFPFDETPDQQAAIDAVLGDMGEARPMDRLVCGDVGFGKTEVALRAAFRAVEAGRQVAVLVPTTLLALQHFEAFRERLERFPVSVEMLSRFRTPRQQRETLAKLVAGQVDVVVGTHRLLSRDVVFKDLGLLVVDEEHRFGVRHKERIKEMRCQVDVLTLTATPIPRTLHLALSGLRDFSIIHTAPEGRQSVKTSVVRFSPGRIQDAVRRELARGGQVFFLHNRVKTIGRMAQFLEKLLPEVDLRVAHGQMSERELEDIMVDFFRGRFQVLVSTTIIESGLDVPAANTIIMNRADSLGLAQLHQLRGRVGRGRERGFCLLLVPPGRTLRTIALERLKAIQENSELGSGYRIARQDLELRGAGNMLGKKQSGHIADVGMAAYMELLEAAVADLRGEAVATGPDPDIDLKVDAWIPGTYIDDEQDRLLEYKRLCDSRTREQLAEHIAILEDRYGKPPPPVLRFERLIETKVRCRDLRVLVLRMIRGGRLQFTFDAATPLDPERLMAWVGRDPRRLSFQQEGVLSVSLDAEQRTEPVEAAIEILKQLAGCGRSEAS
ncbi:MAG TPA: transcription-repair coupling factor [Deltaproteobacteria bacterium]|nr:transcription-repair coupling factor [Deltaproteobacteria bacterium]